jgi:prepilin-type N-terminal cleavage/methylation domain-containing protein/prepilin-type processing-associated H-X9-DG protein
MSSTPNQRRAFTLVELLVVIAIISILAAILFPVFSRARAKALQTACLNNVKQMGMAVQMYAQDYDEILPPSITGPDVMHLVTTMELIQPYQMNTQIMFCPMDTQNGAVDLTGWGLNKYSYGWNATAFALCLPPPGPPPSPVLALTSIPRPCDTTAFYDGLTIPGPDPDPQPDPRHQEGLNVVFLDGHAKWNNQNSPPPGCTSTSYHNLPS